MTDYSIPPASLIYKTSEEEKPCETGHCNTCGHDKPYAAFQLHKSGLPHPPCKDCRSLASARYRAEHKEEVQRRKRAYYLTHREEVIAKAAQWAAAHPEQKAANMQRWNKEHREERHHYNQVYAEANAEAIAAQRLGYREANREKLSQRSSEYARAHPEVTRSLSARKRARKRNADINDLTPAQFLEICRAVNFRCVYCPPDCKACKAKTHKLQQEHLTALAHGGNHTVPNVLPACQKHNYAKHTGPVLMPVQPFLITLAPPHPHKPRTKKANGSS